MSRPYCVYGLVENGVIVYVGYTQDRAERLRSHKSNHVCSRDATMKILGRYSSVTSALKHETYWIQKLRPVLSFRHDQ